MRRCNSDRGPRVPSEGSDADDPALSACVDNDSRIWEQGEQVTDLHADEEGEERSDVESAIAEQIVQLSQATDTPTDFEPTGHAFDPGEVDLGSPSWMTCLADVQGWLRLPEDLAMDDPQTFLATLALGLEFDGVESAVESIDRRSRLNAAGLDRLSGRLQRALQLQGDFLADLEEDGGSRASATGRWREAWEEDDSYDENVAGPVSATAGLWNITDFEYQARTGKLNLSPSYQRSEVWPTTDAQMLIESILRGIPLPSVIILKPEEAGAPYEVVDGKQRLTSILRFIGKHPRAVERVKTADAQHEDVDLQDLFVNDYPKFRRAWKNLIGEQLTATKEKEYCFPFKLRTASAPLQGELSSMQGKYYTQIRNERVRIADDEIEVQELFEQSSKYKLPLIEYSRATKRQIHEVFNLYNRQGKHLNAEEIRNALYHDVDLMRALLVTAGDNDNVGAVAPFLESAWTDLEQISEILDDYGFGTARYRRTKVLSWLASMLLVDSMEDAHPKRMATSRHIDSLLQRIQDDPKDPLRDHAAITDALQLLLQALDAHSAVEEAWSPVFRDTKTGSKWQELQLIASLLGVCIATAALGEDAMDRLADVATNLAERTSSAAWQRPEKTQTATQWVFIATIAMSIVEVLEVDPEDASASLIERFGYSCVPALQAVAVDHQSS